MYFSKMAKKEKISSMAHKLIRYGDGCVYEPMEKALGIRDMIGHFDVKPNQLSCLALNIISLSMFGPGGLTLPWENARRSLN